MSDTNIEWADKVWNPATGCTKVSAGCANCYAATWAHRGMGQWKGRKFEDVRCHEDRLFQPTTWKKPQRVFVNSMTDLFHEAIPDAFRDRVLLTMAFCREHTFQVLTKRPDATLKYFRGLDLSTEAGKDRWDAARRPLYNHFNNRKTFALAEYIGAGMAYTKLPLPNVHLIVTVENQKAADERMPLLIETPVAVKGLSVEPMLEAVDLRLTRPHSENGPEDTTLVQTVAGMNIDWVICGGESGPGARPFGIGWARDLRDQCRAAGVPFFMKQIGREPYAVGVPGSGENDWIHKVKNPKGGDPLEWPEDLRIREFPKVSA